MTSLANLHAGAANAKAAVTEHFPAPENVIFDLHHWKERDSVTITYADRSWGGISADFDLEAFASSNLEAQKVIEIRFLGEIGRQKRAGL